MDKFTKIIKEILQWGQLRMEPSKIVGSNFLKDQR